MYLARVMGTVVATQKTKDLKGTRLMLIQPLTNDQEPTGQMQVAIDVTQAGEGDLVSCVGSREAALSHSPSFVPVDAAIIGIVDQVDLEKGSA
jgi:ethanolamine utilization protein EutN